MMTETAGIGNRVWLLGSGEMVVSGVWPHPEPREITVRLLAGKRAVMQSDARGPELADLLQAQRSMARIGFEQSKVFVRQLAYASGKLPVVKPELRRGEMPHKGVQRPA